MVWPQDRGFATIDAFRPAVYADSSENTRTRELEVRAAEDDHAHSRAELAARERERLWEIEIEHAKARFLEATARRCSEPRSPAGRKHTAYLGALENLYGSDPDATDWLQWIRGHIERLAPLDAPPRMPAQPEINPEDLKPFMTNGIS